MPARKSKMTKPSRRLLSLIAAVIAVGGSGGAAFAFNPQPDPPGFGLVAMVSGQVVVIHAVCSNLPSQLPPDPCHVLMAFRDGAGRTLKRALVELKPGRSASLELAAAGEGRMLVQPVILLDQRSGPVIPTAEIFDSNTSRTALFIAPVNFLPAVQ